MLAGHEVSVVKTMGGDALPECWRSRNNMEKQTQIYYVPRSDVNSLKGRIRVRVAQQASIDVTVHWKKPGE